jgi:hypothetical protein
MFDESVVFAIWVLQPAIPISLNLSPKVIYFYVFLFVAQTRIARLLGVAGTDVPIQDIQKLMMPHKVCMLNFGIDLSLLEALFLLHNLVS